MPCQVGPIRGRACFGIPGVDPGPPRAKQPAVFATPRLPRPKLVRGLDDALKGLVRDGGRRDPEMERPGSSPGLSFIDRSEPLLLGESEIIQHVVR
jgi:hypothetical protein